MEFILVYVVAADIYHFKETNLTCRDENRYFDVDSFYFLDM